MKKIFKLLVLLVFICSVHSVSVYAQKKEKTDAKLWEYKDVINVDSVHLHTYYKIDNYWTGSSYWSNSMSTFESNGMVYFQFFAVLPLYTKTQKKSNDNILRYTREDTLMMYENEDYSYRDLDSIAVIVEQAYAWYGLVFEKVVSSTLTLEEREKVKLVFLEDVRYEIRDIERSKSIQYFQRIDSGYEYDNYIKAINPKTKRTPIIFIPKYEPFK